MTVSTEVRVTNRMEPIQVSERCGGIAATRRQYLTKRRTSSRHAKRTSATNKSARDEDPIYRTLETLTTQPSAAVHLAERSSGGSEWGCAGALEFRQ